MVNIIEMLEGKNHWALNRKERVTMSSISAAKDKRITGSTSYNSDITFAAHMLFSAIEN